MSDLSEIDQFLETVHDLEKTIYGLILKTNLTEFEKKLILNHILIVPGYQDLNEEGDE